MKILFVIATLGTGGAEKILTLLANHLSKKDFDVTILTLTNEKPFYSIDNTVKLKQINITENANNLKEKICNPVKRIIALRKAFIQSEADIIISFMDLVNIYCIIAAKLAKKSIIVSEHTNFHNTSMFIKYLRRLIYPFSDALIVLTDYDKSKYNFVKNVHRIHNPLVIQHMHSDVERERLILGVGSLIDIKGFDLLIKAFSKANTKDWRLIIVGEGINRIELEKLIRKLDLKDKVTLPGITKDIELFYKRASIFVLSSRMEGFPGVLCEAMAYGCPSIAFDCLTGPRDIIKSDVNGILVEVENVNKLAKEIQILINNSEVRVKLGRNATSIIDELDINKISEEWRNVIHGIVSSN